MSSAFYIGQFKGKSVSNLQQLNSRKFVDEPKDKSKIK